MKFLINYASEIFPLHESDNSQTLRAKIHRQANQKTLERYLLDSGSLWGMGKLDREEEGKTQNIFAEY